MRILKVFARDMGYEFNNPSWEVTCLCSDGKTRIVRRMLSWFKPTEKLVQEQWDRFPSLFTEI